MDQLGVDQSLGAIIAFAMAIAGVLVLVVFLLTMYAYFRRRLRAAVGDAQDAAELAAMRDRYVAEVEQSKAWLQESREELLRLEAEREGQERLRRELAEAERTLGMEQEKAEQARRETLELQYAVKSLADDRDRLNDEIGSATERASTALAETERFEMLFQYLIPAEELTRLRELEFGFVARLAQP